ncbi:MAG TPA: ABC transporter substrate-binding protein [Candidatus Lustribacter sp.]|jgi:ABC-type nitrate/sulfonate/bicarbonate transport system substrate-binding protein|nr:ABC transporter substrate-binding protein [Candidatus Lustribacter sp.]
MKRAGFVASIGAIGGAAALLPVAARAQTLTQITVASAPNDDLIALLWGIESGAFRKAGLDIVIQKASSGSAVAAAVAGNAVDIGKSSLVSILAGRSKGFPYVLVAPAGIYSGDGPTSGLVVAPNSTLKTGKDCNGKIMGVGALNDLTALGTMAWVDATGGDSKTLRYVEIPASAMAAAVEAGRIDGGTMPNPQFGQAIASGKVRLLANANTAIARRFLQAAYFATTDYVAKNKALVATFRRVIDEAGAYANAHRAQMIPIISNFTGVEPAAILAQPQQIVATSLDIRLIQPLADAAMKYNIVVAGFDPRTMIDN